MKRICLMGAAMAGLFTVGITTASSAVAKPAQTKTQLVTVTETKLKPKTTHSTVSCKPKIRVQVPAGSTEIIQGSETGDIVGSSACGKALGSGMTRFSYSQDASGDLSGPFQQWFNAGSVFGQVSLSPAEASGPPTTTTFAQQSYAGTITLKGATGYLRGTTGKGTLKCTTQDAIHFTCTETLKLTQTTKVAVKTKVKVPVKVKQVTTS